MKPWKMFQPSDQTSFRILLVVLFKCLAVGPAFTFSVQTMNDQMLADRYHLRIEPHLVDDGRDDNDIGWEWKDALAHGQPKEKRMVDNCWGPGCSGRDLDSRRELLYVVNRHPNVIGRIGGGLKRSVGGISMREKKIEFLEQILEDLLEDDDMMPIYD